MDASQSHKKRKYVEVANATPSPKKKKERKDKGKSTMSHVALNVHKNGKGKARADSTGEFSVVQASLIVSIAPVFASNLQGGAEEMLDSMIMRYIPALQGVVLAHHNLKFLSRTATIKADCPFTVCPICFDATVWRPRVGMKLVGKVNLCSPDHISLLVHRTFNVSIPRHHIPTDSWEFEYGPAENDPEFGVNIDDADTLKVSVSQRGENAKENEEEGSGRWSHKITGTKLGGDDGFLKFTVVGLTVANEMLSLQGSIQTDPFSPEHKPRATRSPDPESEAPDIAEVDEELAEADEDEEIDTFARLAKMGEEAIAEEARRKKQEEQVEKQKKQERKEKKRKRREGDEGVTNVNNTQESSKKKAKGEKTKRKKAAEP
ncbi:hypothetical protein CONPUDRAFT_121639 [Coniophora puteana RWD-64-598 SS2]|uniref:RPA43 OB domain-containing protein n=1 Tax=Coniophora puteana (strain RWD-64-598) TaxID=741705 RepID=A0A5M3MWP2_CONPW|nr:uncharacterized protein CONPUDRAFT_121639 [Coniophora puteana RWD-64-598 SS2]EIW83174.1 hypothetical protein CONPUDRAFT_121639 [Coniophora puteana RWD-64-598 SS2]